LVATPIGNLEDISPRALRMLRQARLVAAEDTRVTAHLFQHFDLHTPLVSYYEHNKLNRLDAILEALGQGDVALVSDAGTPGLNDPGYELVRAVLEAGHAVSPVPGPSAPIAALVASGLPSDRFLYLGYLPRKQGERRQFLEQVAHLPYTLIFLETPHRLLDALADIQGVMGNRPLAAARELTKLYEEIVRGAVGQVRQHFIDQPPRGEFTLVVAGATIQAETWSEARLLAALQHSLASGAAPSRSSSATRGSGWSRRSRSRRASPSSARRARSTSSSRPAPTAPRTSPVPSPTPRSTRSTSSRSTARAAAPG